MCLNIDDIFFRSLSFCFVREMTTAMSVRPKTPIHKQCNFVLLASGDQVFCDTSLMHDDRYKSCVSVHAVGPVFYITWRTYTVIASIPGDCRPVSLNIPDGRRPFSSGCLGGVSDRSAAAQPGGCDGGRRLHLYGGERGRPGAARGGARCTRYG